MRRLFVRTAAAAAVLAVASTAPAAAQIPTSSFEITPLAGYLWGGGFQTPANGGFTAGKISIQPSFAWGGEVGLHAQRQHLVRADLPAPAHRRQLRARRSARARCLAAAAPRPSRPTTSTPARAGSSASGTSSRSSVVAWASRSSIPAQPATGVDLGSSTDFSISGEVGFRYMFGKKAEDQRFGLRAHLPRLVVVRAQRPVRRVVRILRLLRGRGVCDRRAGRTHGRPRHHVLSRPPGWKRNPGPCPGFLVMGWAVGPLRDQSSTLRGAA